MRPPTKVILDLEKS